MPEISRFYGIVIRMFHKEHNPPHFHASYGEYKIVVNINNEVVKGEMPKRALNLIFEWMALHKEELFSNWKKCQEGDVPGKIKPLN